MMIKEIAVRRPEPSDLCRRLHVRRFDFSGSAARGDFGSEKGDLESFVEFDRGHPQAPSLRTFSGFRDALEQLPGRRVDLGEPDIVSNPAPKADIERSRDPVLVAVA